ncbi:MAG: hypothetical protein A2X67_13295 [Ignavibacteria bacterium GWA2_55_11]|nr:MAG: hypothetical protein A2X67_13295 [Ignavibacteria bacterium GWA2_55_11]OGU45099.1 MAG: hypothetical protein A2X68_07365 [Ignavibacteria bacterium GWC2_56_12]OGU66641.1 MAG: hypothetical protein A3C56_12755 [Ignavibacteria bacterium RIFCSPHIGHO2_02_FULL_56_12]OGU71110.1 MAG: hypothetical protein A3G43_10810 [Ignavibacteria bacterium RIFCSPLOWO2_12_FULL_56_21]OGU73675.1 MAG: hypothetical protein A3H45_13585 [Ignavibacteria bacterium RIFCSPLOWO2_02_FULL_55_14]HAV22165.1 ethanolamine utiliz
MPEYALGLVETRGLIAAIEAADAMVKAANVVLVGKERTDPAMITIKIVGETAAVRSAVDAGAAAAQRVGTLVSTHVIPRPAEGIEDLIFARGARSLADVEAELLGHDERSEDSDEEAEDDGGPEPSEPEGLNAEDQAYFRKLAAMSVHELRRHARGISGLPIHGREISRANKQELMEALLKARNN